MTFEWLAKEMQRIDEGNRHNELLDVFIDNDADYFTVVINSDGSCIAHPEGKSVKMTQEQVGRSLELRKKGVIDLEVNGVPSRVYYAPIEHVDWSVALVVKK